MYTQEFLRITKEATFGVFDAAATETAIIQLDQANAFTMRAKPLRWSIRTHGSNNRRVQTGSAKTQLAGSLSTLIYPSQAALLLPWGADLDATTGQAYSVTIDHAITMEDATPTVIYRRYLGCKVGSMNIAGSDESQLLRLKLDLVAQKPSAAAITATDFPTPTLADYPADAPYLFQHAAAGFTLDGSVTEFNSFDLTVKNILDATFNASQYVTRIKNCGRDVDLKTKLVYQRATDRAKFEGVTAITIGAVFTNGVNTLTFDLNTKNFYADVSDDLPLDKVKYQEVSLESYVDGTDGDFILTVV